MLKSGELIAHRYLIAETLGQGAGGFVYRAFDRGAQVWVALKLLWPTERSGPPSADQLYRELRLGRPLNHPNVCRIHDVFEADGRCFLAMEYASGGSLRATLNQPASDRAPADTVNDARALIAGLAAIHAAGLLHRDFKPENILRLGDGRLVISDFGVAQVLEQTTTATNAAGTPGYVAPEILAGGKASQASDVWSLGVVLHEALAGCRPQWSGSRLKLRLADRGSSDPILATIVRICKDCLEVDPGRRPATAVEVAARVESEIRRRSRSNRARMLMLGLGFTGAALGAGLIVDRVKQRPGPPAAVPTGLGEDWSRARILFRPTGRNDPLCWHAIPPDHRRIRAAGIYVNPTVFDIDIASGRQTLVDVAAEYYLGGCPSVSTDGNSFLFDRQTGGRTQVMHSSRPDGRNAVPVARGSHPTWLPSGKSFLFVTDDSGIAMGDLDGRTKLLARNPPAPESVTQIAVDDRGEFAAARTRQGGAQQGPWLELYDLRRLRHVRSWRLEGNLPGKVAFNRSRGTFQVPTMKGGHQILVELSKAGELVPVGHIPGVSISGAVRVDQGMVVSTVRPGNVGTFLVGPDQPEQLIAPAWITGSVSSTGEVAYVETRWTGLFIQTRLSLWRPGSPPRTELLAEGREIGSPQISLDGKSVVYYRIRQGEIYHCDLSAAAAGKRCQLVHLDPALNAQPLPGPVSPDGKLFPYFAIDARGTEGKVLRMLSLPSRQVRDLISMDAACPMVWASERTFWTLAVDDSHWREMDARSGQRTSRTWRRSDDPPQIEALRRPPPAEDCHPARRAVTISVENRPGTCDSWPMNRQGARSSSTYALDQWLPPTEEATPTAAGTA
jgi:hypothetical protein